MSGADGKAEAQRSDASPAAHEPVPPKPVPTVSDIFGQVTWLMTQSKGHRNFFVSDLEWLAMPPLLLRQFRIFPGKDQPLGVALWAKLSDEAAARLASGSNRLAPGEWNSGPNLWLVELIAPFGHQDKMLEDLQKTVFPGQSFRMHATDKDGKRQIVTLEGVKAGEGTKAGADDIKVAA